MITGLGVDFMKKYISIQFPFSQTQKKYFYCEDVGNNVGGYRRIHSL